MDLPAPFDAIVATIFAALLGAAIGAEREWRRHPGGLRSAALVAAAACVFARIALTFGGSNPGAALGAIATGVGFLGAGVILRQGNQVRGLSTAATFWAVAAIGTAAGVFEYAQAVALTLVVFFAHVALRPLSAWIDRKAPPEDNGPRCSMMPLGKPSRISDQRRLFTAFPSTAAAQRPKSSLRPEPCRSEPLFRNQPARTSA